MDVTAYCKDTNGKLMSWTVFEVTDMYGAIQVVKGCLDDDKTPYKKPILLVIQGGKLEQF